jgi:hypothetical protein
VIQLKALSVIRVGQQQKKVNIDIPKLDAFIHRAYTLLARKVYANVYLFEANLAPLQIQRNYRELEVITKDCIMEAIRESIPVNEILRAYLDDTIEEAVETKVEEKILETTPVEEPASTTPTTANEVIAVPTEGITTTETPATPATSTSEPAIAITAPIPGDSGPSQTIAFNDEDEHQSAEDSTIKRVSAPKDVATLEQISDVNHARRMAEESDEEDDEEEDRIQIHTESAEVNPIELNIHTI